MAVYQSGEDYLETIYVLKRRNGTVRSIDIAHELNFSKPSVSRAVGILKEDGLIVTDREGYLELTEAGQEKAKNIYERHEVLTRFLTEKLGVSAKTAEEDACRMEHVISTETFEQIKACLDRS